MAVAWNREDEGFKFIAVTGDATQFICFSCSKPLDFPFIYWSGASGFVHFHPGCIQDWMLALMRDCLEIKHGQGSCSVHKLKVKGAQ